MHVNKSRIGKHWSAWLRVLAFPLLFGGVGLLAWLFYTPAVAVWLLPALVGAVFLLAAGLERLIAYAPEWNIGRGDSGGDAIYLLVTQAAVLGAEVAVWSGVAIGFGTFGDVSAIWPVEWPVPLQILMALVVGDFLSYLYHRASHESGGVLWRIHAIHHAPQRLYTLNFARFHPINAFVTASLTLLPLALLGAPPTILFVAAVLHNAHGVLSHANVDFRLGPLNWIFSMTELHRWHHARDLNAANANYGATLIVWDIVFGTRRLPDARLAADGIGTDDPSLAQMGLLGQLLHPFRKRPSQNQNYSVAADTRSMKRHIGPVGGA